MDEATKRFAEPPYWTLDTSLFTGQFRYFGREPVLVRGKLHLANEPYSKSDVDLEIVPLTQKQGSCTYVNLRAYVLVPDITVTIGLFKTPAPTGAIGEVLSSQEKPKMREQEIGDGQAWYYPADKTIVLWECGLYSHFEEGRAIHQDPNMTGLWSGFEGFLTSQFAEAKQIATTYADPDYQTDQYQQFLRSLGYAPHAGAKAAWSKSRDGNATEEEE